MPKKRKKPAVKRRTEQFHNVIGQNTRNLRIGADLTLLDIAEHLNVTYQQVQKYESGTNRLPLEYLPQLCDLFGVPAELMLAGLPRVKARVDHDVVHVQYCIASVRDKKLREKIVRVVDLLVA